MNRHVSLVIFQKIRIIILLLVVDIFFFSLVNPVNSSSFMVIIGCLLVALTLYVIFRVLIKVFAAFVPVSGRSQRRFATFITILLVFLLLMQSIGQLSLHDAIAVVPLMVVLYVYLTYNSKDKLNQA
ncbi:MAG: hypothetical protein ACREF5_00900 [Candidatus Saccharimonadales bacterium]